MSTPLQVLPFRLAMRRPLSLATGPLRAREGRLLALPRDAGGWALGEVSPMAGVHASGLAQVDPLLLRLADGEGLGDALPPVLAFGLDILARDHQDDWPTARHEQVPIAGLFTGPLDEVDAFAAARGPGLVSLKVKVGSDDPQTDNQRLRALLAALPEDVRLRPDANRRWQPADAEVALAGIAPERVEFLEEPLIDPSRLPRLRERTGMAYALDESETLVDDAVRAAASAWVLKWSREGPLVHIQDRLDAAQQAGRQVVISSAFESGIGLYAQARLALALNEVPVACGLGTAAWMAEDVLAPAYPLSPDAIFAHDRRPDLHEALASVLRGPGGTP